MHRTPGGLSRPAPQIAVRLLHAALFLAILGSFLVFIEPSPYEGLTALLAFACLLARVPIDMRIVPMVALLLLFNIGGAIALIPHVDDDDSVRFVLISIYLALTAVIFAMIFSRDTLARVRILRHAYILAALCTALIGIGAYFQAIPGAEMFTIGGRARATFKDANVYGPYLVLPLLFLLTDMFVERIRLSHVVIAATLAIGIFLSFSRAAWAHIIVSAGLMVLLLFMTSASGWLRARIVTFSLAMALMAAAMLAVLLSIGDVGALFKERASLNQSYDTLEGGRFSNQQRSIAELLERPNGYGPLQFRNRFKLDPHQVYINAFASYGWLGGISYVTLVITTLLVGLWAVFRRTPWQNYLIAVYATYAGVAAEGVIIDSDHWRHYYLLLGMIWGMAAATSHYCRRSAQASDREPSPDPERGQATASA